MRARGGGLLCVFRVSFSEKSQWRARHEVLAQATQPVREAIGRKADKVPLFLLLPLHDSR